jgi:SAM-dependent methyltransferase
VTADPPEISADRHNREIHENLARWRQKPLLRDAYRDFYRLLARHLTREVPGATLELGSGIGAIKEVIPDCTTSDVFPNPWLDRCENAYRLSMPTASVANLILFDVWHHLEFPGTALTEIERVVAPGGRLLVFDPDMSWFGRILYGLFHHEPLGWKRPLTWDAPPNADLLHSRYFAAQASAHRVFVRDEAPLWKSRWSVVARHRMASFAYAATGGFRGPQLYPARAAAALRLSDRLLSRLPEIFSTRLLIVLERKAGADLG